LSGGSDDTGDRKLKICGPKGFEAKGWSAVRCAMSWNRIVAWGILWVTVTVCSAELLPQVEAQSFRDRVLGGTLSKRSRAGASASGEGTGTLSGAERFLRSNRTSKSFVGASPEAPGFVGSVQADETAGPATNNINANRAQLAPTLLNPPRSVARKTGIYEPKLNPAFQLPASESRLNSQSLTTTIRKLGSEERFAGARVSLSEGTAVLQGRVGDLHDRELLAALLKLEPGVESVRNELVVEPPPVQPSSP